MPIFGSLYLRNSWCNLVEIWYVGVLTEEDITIAKIIWFCINSTKLRMRENCIIVHAVARRLLNWATQHTIMCLFLKPRKIIYI